VPFGIYNGQKGFIATQPIDITAMSEGELLDLFENAHLGLGRDVRYFVANDEVEAANNNNTFTWSGPSGVLGCTGQRRVAPPAGGVQPNTLDGRRLSRCAIERR
jgi:hypothetical protein